MFAIESVEKDEGLSSQGHLFLQHAKNHMKTAGGDCFAASLWEYIDMINKVGKVEELLYTKIPYKKQWMQTRGLETVVICASNK